MTDPNWDALFWLCVMVIAGAGIGTVTLVACMHKALPGLILGIPFTVTVILGLAMFYEYTIGANPVRWIWLTRVNLVMYVLTAFALVLVIDQVGRIHKKYFGEGYRDAD